MRRHLVNGLLLPSLVTLGLGLTACGGGSSAESLANEHVSVMTDFTATLAKITDKASAEKYKGDLEAAIAKMNAIKAKVDALPADKREPSKEEQAKLEPKMTELGQKMMGEMMRVGSNPELGATILPVLEKIQQ